MIKVFFEKEQGRYKFTIEGHAGYAPIGKDIVCAGASVLYYALEAGMRPYITDKTIKPEGKIIMEFVADDEEVRVTDAVWQAVMSAYKLLADDYPEYLLLKTRGGIP